MGSVCISPRTLPPMRMEESRNGLLLQVAIQNKMKSIHNVIEMLTDIIGDKKAVLELEHSIQDEIALSHSPKSTNKPKVSAKQFCIICTYMFPYLSKFTTQHNNNKYYFTLMTLTFIMLKDGNRIH